MSFRAMRFLIVSVGMLAVMAFGEGVAEGPNGPQLRVTQYPPLYVPPLVVRPDCAIEARPMSTIPLADTDIPGLQLSDRNLQAIANELQPLLRHLLAEVVDETPAKAIAQAVAFLSQQPERRWMTPFLLTPVDPPGQQYWSRAAKRSADAGAGSDALGKGDMSFMLVDAPASAVRDAEANLSAMMTECGDPLRASCGSYLKEVSLRTYGRNEDEGQPFVYVHTGATIHVKENTVFGIFGQPAVDIVMSLHAIRRPHPLGEVTTSVGTGEKVNFLCVVDWVIPFGDKTVIVSFLDYDFFGVQDGPNDVRCDLQAGHRYWKTASERDGRPPVTRVHSQP